MFCIFLTDDALFSTVPQLTLQIAGGDCIVKFELAEVGIMMEFVIKRMPFTKDQVLQKLKERGILINQYAEEFISHPRFSAGQPGEMIKTIASLKELGLEKGATLDELLQHIRGTRLNPCPPDTGLFLRLAWTDQPQSRNSVLTGTHNSPDMAVTVLSEMLKTDDAFPKGLYLRNVDGTLWLRGYVCDSRYSFPGNALFAFECVG